ncbi:MAG TPA: ABC transporter ATP-binding protein [Thermoplasmata archaeon]|nr:ABC transporter ATP-binding protein [Thermoplasmata archaeon]
MSGLALDGVVVRRGGFALGPVGLSVAPGTATALLGPSGAGKTTLLRAVAGFLPLDAGEVRLDGRRVDELPPERRRFGFVPPNLGLFPHRRVRQNVAYPLAIAGRPDAAARTRQWIERFGLARLADRYPAELSTGERQRVAMARALAAEPAALLWDEPLAALDVEGREVLLGLLQELLDSVRLPLVLVTHDPSTAAALASAYVVLDAGRVRFAGSPRALADAPLDRFTARFLGYDNLYSRDDLAAAGAMPIGRALLAAAGPGGVAVPPSALRWRAGPGGSGAVAGVRSTPAGWVVALRDGPLLFRVRVDGPVPGVRVGETVALELDPAALRPLDGPAGAA